MPKNNKSVGRKKWIAGGIIGFASVTLIATGFATWVIGSQDLDDTGDVTVAVDTAQNNSVTLEINIDPTDNSLFLGGKDTSGADSGITNPVVSYQKGSDEEEEKAEDLSIKFTYKITAGADYYNSLADTGVKIEFSVAKDSPVKLDVTLDDDTNATEKHEGSLTYLDVPSSITISKDDFGEAQSDGTYVYEVTMAEELEFSWGSYFNHMNPITYYNTLFQTGGDSGLDANDAADLQAVIDELNAMNAAITGDSESATLKLTAKMDKLPAA